MKYVKMLALAAVAASALMAFLGAGTASATVLCSTTADPCPLNQDWPAGTILDFSIPSGSSANLTETGGETIDTCTTSTVKGELTKTGGSAATPTGKITELTWGGCTFPTKTLTTACLEIHKIGSTSNGTVTADKCTHKNEKGEEVTDETNTEVTINTIFFGSCIYTVEAGNSIGDLTEGKGAGAKFTASAVARKVSGSNIACPETSKWSATYVLTTPSETTLSVSSS